MQGAATFRFSQKMRKYIWGKKRRPKSNKSKEFSFHIFEIFTIYIELSMFVHEDNYMSETYEMKDFVVIFQKYAVVTVPYWTS